MADSTREVRNHHTPSGGVRSEILYRDDDGNPAPKIEATRAEIIEYDEDGKVLRRTYGRIEH